MDDAFMLALRILASLSSTGMILSPSPAIYKIYKTRTVGYTSIIALVSVLGNCHMWMLYGCLYHRFFPVVTTFALGDVIALFFIAVYYRYTTERRYVQRVLGVVVGLLAVMTLYTVFGAHGVTKQKRSHVEYIVGSVGIVASMLLYGAGFEKIIQVLKLKTAVFLPIHMVVAGTVNQTLWLLYLGLDRNWFMFASSVMCATLCVAQLVLYWIYHPSKSKGTSESKVVDTDAAIEIASLDVVEEGGERGGGDASVSIAVDLAVGKDDLMQPHLHLLEQQQAWRQQQQTEKGAVTAFQLVLTPRIESQLLGRSR